MSVTKKKNHPRPAGQDARPRSLKVLIRQTGLKAQHVQLKPGVHRILVEYDNRARAVIGNMEPSSSNEDALLVWASLMDPASLRAFLGDRLAEWLKSLIDQDIAF